MPRLKGFSSGFSNGFGNPLAKSYIQIITPVQTGTYEDGDILSAVTYRNVRAERANGLCFAKTLVNGVRQMDRLNGNGLYNAGDVLEDWFEATSQFKYERLNNTQCRVTRLSDSNEIVFNTNEPFVQHDGKTVQMDVDLFLRRRKATLAGPGGRGRPIFGTPGNEYWYGGRTTTEHANLDTVWVAIESKLGVNEVDVADKAVFSDYRKRLVIAVNDMSDADAAALTQSKVDTEAVTIDSVVQDDTNQWTLTLSATAPTLANTNGAQVVIGIDEYSIDAVNGSDVQVSGSVTPVTGPANIQATTAKRANKIEWRNLRDVVEPDVLDRKVEVRIDTIRKHVREDVVGAK